MFPYGGLGMNGFGYGGSLPPYYGSYDHSSYGGHMPFMGYSSLYNPYGHGGYHLGNGGNMGYGGNVGYGENTGYGGHIGHHGGSHGYMRHRSLGNYMGHGMLNNHYGNWC